MKAAGLIALAAVVIAGAASAADTPLRVISQTGNTITFGYDAVPGADGYHYFAGGAAVARTFDPAKLTVKFAKGASSYRVVPLDVTERPDGFCYPAGATCGTPPPPPTTISGSECASRASVNGATIANVTVTGDCSIRGDNVTLKNATVQGVVYFTASSNGSSLLDSSALGFQIESADNTLIQGDTFNGQNRREQNFIWAVPAPDPADGFTIRNNSFANYTSPSTTHSEALFIGGYTRNGMIEGNTFYRNGNTAHIFFSWCAPNDCSGTGGRYVGDPRDPSNICVRDNTFDKTWIAYFQVVIRQENNAGFPPVSPNGHGIYTDDNIRIAPNQSAPGSTGTGGSTDSSNYVQFQPGDNLWASGSC